MPHCKLMQKLLIVTKPFTMVKLTPVCGGNGSHGNSSRRIVHQETASEHSGKSGMSPHL